MAANSLAVKQVPIVPREVFDRLSRVHRAVLLVMEQDGDVRIGSEGQGKEMNPAPHRGAPL